MIKRLLVFFTCLIILFAVYPSRVFSSEQFQEDYNLTYSFFEDGKTKVTQETSFTNLTTNFYASEYALIINSTTVSNVKAWDADGKLTVAVQEKEGLTHITVKFSKQVVGKSKKLSWTLQYDVTDFSSKNGQVWEINVPRLSTIDDVSSYNVTLTIPESYGNLLYISPKPKQGYLFTKDEISHKGINAAFGNNQIFNFTLSYHLYNPKPVMLEFEIALPPDTAYQRLLYKTIQPKPKTVTIDPDGNYLATFVLKSGEDVTVLASGSAQLSLDPLWKPKALTQEERDIYLLSDIYWEKDDPSIVEKARELKTPRALYDFLVSEFSYNKERVSIDAIEENGTKRLGAKEAFANPQDLICTEFTDLFIALARAAGIPAREVNGYAFTNNPDLRPLSLRRDILHAWPEYWDEEKGWISIDPTWGNTNPGIDYFEKLDLNHFAFVVHGIDSENPYPAGSYKVNGEEGKDVYITFGTTKDMEGVTSRILETSLDLPSTSISGFDIQGTLRLLNKGGNTVYDVVPELSSTNTFLTPRENFTVERIPPYGLVEIPFTIEKTSFFTHDYIPVSVTLDDTIYSKTVSVRPIAFLSLIGGIILVIAGGAFIFTKTTWRLPFQKQKR